MARTDPCMGENSNFLDYWGIQYHRACCSDKNKAPDTLPVVAPPQRLGAQCQWRLLASWGCWLWRLSSETGATSIAGGKLGRCGYHRVAPAMAAIGVLYKRGGRAARSFARVASWRRSCAHHWLDSSSWCTDWRTVTKPGRCQKRARRPHQRYCPRPRHQQSSRNGRCHRGSWPTWRPRHYPRHKRKRSRRGSNQHHSLSRIWSGRRVRCRPATRSFCCRNSGYSRSTKT